MAAELLRITSTKSLQIIFLCALLAVATLIEAKDKDKDGDDGKEDKKKDKDKEKKPEKRVKAKGLKHSVKDGEWPAAVGPSQDFLFEDAKLEFLRKWQPQSDKTSKKIGPKTQNKFAAKDLCTKEFPCNTITNASIAKMTKGITGETKPEPIRYPKMDKFLKYLSKKKTVKLSHTIHKDLLFGGEVHHAGIIARLTAFKKKDVESDQAVAMVFDAWKMTALQKKATAIRAVLPKTDDQPTVLQSICLFPNGSNKAQADNFCQGKDKEEEKDDDDEKDEQGGKDKKEKKKKKKTDSTDKDDYETEKKADGDEKKDKSKKKHKDESESKGKDDEEKEKSKDEDEAEEKKAKNKSSSQGKGKKMGEATGDDEV